MTTSSSRTAQGGLAAHDSQTSTAGLRRPGRQVPLWLQGSSLLVSLLALLPVVFIVAISIQTGWSTVVQLVFRPRVAELLFNTSLLVVVTVPLCTLLGVSLAWLTECSTLPARGCWRALAVAPLAVPAFVHSYAWISLLPAFNGVSAAVLLSVIAYTPFIYLPVTAALRRMDPALEDSAASLGLTPLAVFRRVTLPQLKLAIWGGGLLISLHLLAEYGLYAMLRFDTFTTAIFDQFQSSFNGPAANMLAGVLALCCLGLLWLEAGTRGNARYARLGSGSARQVTPVRLGAWTLPALLLCLLSAALSLGVPLITLGHWLWKGGIESWQNDSLWPALQQTVLLGLLGAVLTVVAAVPLAWLSVRAVSRLQRLQESCNYITSALPGIVTALALATITTHYARPLYQTIFTILLAYLLMFLPRALVSLRAGIAQAPAELEQAAGSLGSTPGQALRRVTLRLAAPGAAAGLAMVFLAISNELTATLLLAPNGTRTLATGFWAMTSEIDYIMAAPYALLMVLLSLPLTWLLHDHSKRSAGR